MFARTERLLLRPGWAEDAPTLARAIADEQVVRNLATAPWPYRQEDAEAYLAAPRDPAMPSFLITQRTDGDPIVVGACGLGRRPSGAVELGYWIARPHWGKGFATEAGRALIDIARALRLPRLEASHFLDNPASGRVLEKLGFVPTGLSAARYSCARGGEAMSRLYRLSLMGRGEVEAMAA
jgi:RimJ/RimL family protein N-acetyltransferase